MSFYMGELRFHQNKGYFITRKLPYKKDFFFFKKKRWSGGMIHPSASQGSQPIEADKRVAINFFIFYNFVLFILIFYIRMFQIIHFFSFFLVIKLIFPHLNNIKPFHFFLVKSPFCIFFFLSGKKHVQSNHRIIVR